MELDFSSCGVIQGTIVFPDFVFPDLPRQNPITDQTDLTGTSATGVSITGSIGTEN